MAPMNTKTKGVVPPNLTAKKFEEAQSALARLRGDKDKPKTSYEGSPFKAPSIHPYKIKIGKNAGKIGWVIRFEHKANPAWSISIKLKEADLIMANLEEFKACIPALRHAIENTEDATEE